MNPRRMNRSVRWLLTTWLLLTMILTLTRPAQAAGYVVTNLNDSGKGSLRQAILNANAAAGQDTITFSISGTILLSSTLPAISDVAGLNIDGTGRSITISGNDTVRVMSVNGGAAVTLRNLTVAGGYAAIGGGIYNAGTLNVRTSTFFGNSAYEDFGPGGAGIANYGTLDVSDSAFSSNRAAVGGGIVNFGSVTVTNSTFSGNSGSGPDGGGGGGFANYGTLDVSNSTFSGNVGDNEGGGIFNRGTLRVTGSTFSGNHVGVFGTGGGIYNAALGTLTVTDSTFSGNSAFENGTGGGIANSGTLTVTDSTFSGNIGQLGGGIYNSSGMLTVTDSTFSSNSGDGTDGGDGGGIYNTGGLTLTNSIFSDNTARVKGGGILNFGTLSVANSTFSGNIAPDGGGIFNDGGLVLTDSTFSANTVDNYGGGIFNEGTLNVTSTTFLSNFGLGGGIANAGTLEVTNGTFSGNSGFGGGIYNVFSGTLTVNRTTFSSNNCGGGDGCAIMNDGTATVTNSTLSGNSGYFGGGIFNAGTLTVTNSTLSGNTSQTDGAIFNSGTLTFNNTIVTNSTSVNCTNNGSLIDGGGNLSWPDTTCPGLNADPLLGPLQDNGGPTQTHALQADSPAIDVALAANCPATDQRGVSRPQGAGCDIGAYESGVVYNFSGFFQPVDNLPTLNVVQAGVGVPVRFSLGGDHGLDIFAAGYPISQKIACNSAAPQDAIEETVIVGSSSLSYDAASDTYTYVWKTSKAWAGTCRQLIIRLNDGTEHQANFKFVR